MKKTMKTAIAFGVAALSASLLMAEDLLVDGGEYREIADDPATVGEVRLGTTANNPDRAVLVLKPTGTFEFTDRFRVGYESGTYGSVTQECGTVRIGKGGEAQNCIGYSSGSTEWSEYVILPGAFLDGWTNLEGSDRGFDVGRHGNGRLIVDGGTYKSYLDLRIGVESDGKGELIVKNGGTFELHNNGGWPNPIVAARSGSRVVVTGEGSTITVSEYIRLRRNANLYIEDGGRVTVPFIYADDNPGSVYVDGGILQYDDRLPKSDNSDYAGKNAAQQGWLIDGVVGLYVGEGGMTVDIPEGSSIKLHTALLKDPALGDTACGSFTKTGGGTLVLEEGNTIDGNIVIAGGVLEVPSATAIDTTKVFEYGGTLFVHGGSYTVAYNSTQTLSSADVAAIIAALQSENAETLRFEIAADAVVTVNDAVELPAGAGVNLAGSGTLVLNGSNYWTGETLIEGGILVANHGVGVPLASHVQMSGGTWAASGRIAASVGSGAGEISFGQDCCCFAAVGGDLEIAFNPDGSGVAGQVNCSDLGGTMYFNYATGDHVLKILSDVRVTKSNGYIYSNYDVDFVGGISWTREMRLRGAGKVILSGPVDSTELFRFEESVDVVLTNANKRITHIYQDRSSGESHIYSTAEFREIYVADEGHDGAYASTMVIEEGAAVRVNQRYRVGIKEGALGVLRINGGSLTMAGTADTSAIGYNQNNTTGIVEVVSGAVTNGTAVYVGGRGWNWDSRITGILRLYGGEFVAPQISACLDSDRVDSQGYITSIIDFNGGRMVISQDQSELFKFVDTITTGANGGVIDTAGHDVKIVADASCYSSTGILSKVGEGELELDWIPFGEGGFEVGGGTVRVPSGTIPAAVPETDGGDVPVQTLYFADGGKLVCDGDLDLSNVVLAFRDHAVPVNYFASHTPRRWTLVETTGTLTVGSSTIPRGTSTHGYSYYVTEHAVMVDRPSGLAIIVR